MGDTVPILNSLWHLQNPRESSLITSVRTCSADYPLRIILIPEQVIVILWLTLYVNPFQFPLLLLRLNINIDLNHKPKTVHCNRSQNQSPIINDLCFLLNNFPLNNLQFPSNSCKSKSVTFSIYLPIKTVSLIFIYFSIYHMCSTNAITPSQPFSVHNLSATAHDAIRIL